MPAVTTLSKEQIHRMLGAPRPAPVRNYGAARPPMTKAEKTAIRKAYKDDSTLTVRKLSKKFGRSVGAIWKTIKQPV